jgi:hypothetical protein
VRLVLLLILVPRQVFEILCQLARPMEHTKFLWRHGCFEITGRILTVLGPVGISFPEIVALFLFIETIPFKLSDTD